MNPELNKQTIDEIRRNIGRIENFIHHTEQLHASLEALRSHSYFLFLAIPEMHTMVSKVYTVTTDHTTIQLLKELILSMEKEIHLR